MRKRDIVVLIIVIGITAALSIFVIFTSIKAEEVTHVETLAYQKLNTYIDNQKSFFNRILEEKFASLESLSYYLGIKDEMDFPAEHEYSDAVMLANHFDAICLSDLNGSAMACDGRKIGSIADQPLFQEASEWKGMRAVQYSENCCGEGKPGILIAVPVRHNNVLTRILYAEIPLADCEEMLMEDNIHGNEAVFVTDSAGKVILCNKNAYGVFDGQNIFERFLTNAGSESRTKEHIINDMLADGDGYFSHTNAMKEYVCYSALGVNDWYIFAIVSDEAIAEEYSANREGFRDAVKTLCAAFFVLAVCATAILVYFILSYYRTGRKLRRKNLILEANDAFMLSNSALPIKDLRASGLAEQIAERAYGSGSIITSILDGGKVKLYFVSIGILESLGYSEDELNKICEKDVSRLIHPDDLAATVETNLKNTHVGDSFQLTVRYRKKNGDYLWIQEYSHIFQLEDGTAVCASQFVDITRQKELEHQLRSREEEYRIAASMSRYVIMRYEVQSRTLAILARGTCTQTFDGVLDNVPEQAIQNGYVAPESIETARRVFRDIDRGIKQQGKTVLALDIGSGSRMWTEMSYSVVSGGEEESPMAAILTFVDVTEKRRAEEFINIGSAFMDYATNAKLIIANLSSGRIEYEAPGTIHRNFTEITGSDDIYTNTQYALQHAVAPDYVDPFSEFLSVERLLKELENGDCEESIDTVIIGTNGVEKWVNFQARLTRDSFSGDAKAYLVLKDIDVQKNVEQELYLEKSEGKNARQGETENRQIFARTFGYFDLFVDGKPLHFANQKEKELLAILIDRNGGTLSAEEAISILWEDEPSGEKQLSRYRKLASRLKNTLAEVGCDDIIITSHGVRHIDGTKIECDYYEVLGGNSKFIKLYQGIYMLNYSWAEETTAALNRLLLFDEEN